MTTDALPRDLLPLTDNQRDLLEAVSSKGDHSWASTQLKTRLMNLGLLAYTGERGLHPTTLGEAVLEVDQHHYPIITKRLLGSSPIKGGGRYYGTTARCRCGGWKHQNNESPTKDGRAQAKRSYGRHAEEILKEKLG